MRHQGTRTVVLGVAALTAGLLVAAPAVYTASFARWVSRQKSSPQPAMLMNLDDTKLFRLHEFVNSGKEAETNMLTPTPDSGPGQRAKPHLIVNKRSSHQVLVRGARHTLA